MKLPIILQADDGVSWWPGPSVLEISVESPDIEAGIYEVWDAEGQVLELGAARPVSPSRFLDIQMVSVSPSVLKETGKYEPDKLRSVISAHLEDRLSAGNIDREDLASVLAQLCREQPAG